MTGDEMDTSPFPSGGSGIRRAGIVAAGLVGLTAAAALAACQEPAEEREEEIRDGPAAVEAPGEQERAPEGVRRAPESGLPVLELTVGGHPVTAEVAEREEDRRRGLMGRDSLPPDHGMLFVYPDERTLSFWMRDTRIPLDIAFLDRRGYIVDIQAMEPETEERYSSRAPAMYALELNQGWFEEHGVEVGDRVEF